MAEMRARRTSRNVGGNGPPAPSSPAMSSSSMKNGLPSDRRWIRSVRSPDGGAPRIASSSVARIGRIEALQVDPFDPAAAIELGEPRQERMPAVQLVRPEGHDQDDPIRPEVADQERDGLAGRRIGPVEVLDDEDDRGDLRQPLEQAQDGVEQARLERFALGHPVDGVGRAERRHEMGEVGPRRADDRLELVRIQLLGEAPQGLDERRVRDAPVADVRRSRR